MLDELIQLSAGQGRARGRDRDGPPRPAQRARPQPRPRPTTRSSPSSRAPRRSRRSRPIPQGGTGDVKYHHGARGLLPAARRRVDHRRLESNPSHLEYVGPVVDRRRARGADDPPGPARPPRHQRRDSRRSCTATPPSPARAWWRRRSTCRRSTATRSAARVHLIQNNQVGFTTDPDDARSTRWASDLAKGFDVPIIHVNADDVAACIAAVRLAFAFRQEFGHDVLIDLIGYRRFGHNEADEPAYTQPEMYREDQGAPARARDLRRAADRGGRRHQGRGRRARRRRSGSELTDLHQRAQGARSRPSDGGRARHRRVPARPLALARGQDGGVGGPAARSSTRSCCAVPEGFTVHPKLVKQLERRREALGADGGIDWAHAERWPSPRC